MSLSSNILPEYSLTIKIIQGIEIPLGIMINCICLIYIVFMLKLNATIKQILIADTVINLISLICSSIGYICIIMAEIRTPVSCTLMVFSGVAAFTCSTLMTTTLSYIRYQMAYKASLGRIYDTVELKYKLNVFVCILCLSQFATSLYIANYNIGFTVGQVFCSGGNRSRIGVLNFIMLLGGFCISMYYDLALVNFVKKQSRVQPTQMVVWSTQPHPRTNSTREILNNSVPIRSTILSALGILFMTVASVLSASGQRNDWMIIGAARAGLHMAWTLTITVKSSEKEKKHYQSPPRDLQFHESSNLEE